MKKKFLWYLPALLFFIPLGTSRNSELVLFPTDKKYEIKTYIDTADSEGNSSCRLTKVTDSLIVFDFTLHKVHGDPYAGFTINLFQTDSAFTIYPYAGFSVNLSRVNGFIDISSYDSLCVDIVSRQASFFEIQLKTFIENVTEMNDFRTCHTTTCRVPVDLKLKRYSLPMEDFKLASWWDKWTIKKFGSLAKGLSRKPDYSKLFSINFQGGVESAENAPLRFIIAKIAFVKKSKRGAIAMICGACFAAYAIAVFLLGFIAGKFKENKIQEIQSSDTVFDPHPVPPEMIDLEYKQLETYINKNYTNSGLTLEDVAHGVGISPPRVTIILQQKKNMTFPQYLNDVRVAAAKKLLSATKLLINDIGYNVGYNNIPHFNRVFSKIANCSPGEFRDKNKGRL